MSAPGLKERTFSFNQAERDLWVSRRAKECAPGSRVLDVGAGACPYRADFSHCRYEAHDFAVLDTAQLPTGYGSIDYRSDITAIPVPDGSFDVVLCTEVIEHVPDPVAAVREMARILRPGGRLLLTAPLGAGLHQQPYHFYGGYTPYWYERFLSEIGFQNITVEPNAGFFRWYGQESQRFNALLHPKNQKRIGRKVAAAVLWLLSYPVMRLLMPPLCLALDRFDEARHFTVGYHVTAERR